MPLQITNTMTRKQEPFQPAIPGKVRMYVCGVTVYDYCHVGHGRAYVVFDIVRRWLSHLGYEVTYVRNFTDVDDKIIKRANERGVEPRMITEQFIDAFHDDMKKLGLVPPDVEPKATEHIPEMIKVIEQLIARGHAYAADGDVYFSVASYKPYGKLSRKKLEDLRSGEDRVIDPGEKKKDPADFALWKKAKPEEGMSWKSPWGEGRPGWHIECSAMSRKYLGDGFDIHGGGEDLIFPHHENEIAQSEASTGADFAHVWLHNAFVQMNSVKMSKSLGNVVPLKEVLQRYPGEVFRHFVLNAHYRKPLDFTDETIQQSQESMVRLYDAIFKANEKLQTHLGHTLRIGPPEGEEFVEAEAFLKTMETRFEDAMNDDFNTSSAVSVLFEAARLINKICIRPSLTSADPPKVPRGEDTVLTELREKTKRLAKVLGLLTIEPEIFLEDLLSRGVRESGLSQAEIDQKIDERHRARASRDFKKADEIRAWLKERGVVLEDKPDGSTHSRRG
jgi:cysteinyl-tRNA synthetase